VLCLPPASCLRAWPNFFSRLPQLQRVVGLDAREFAELASTGFLYEKLLDECRLRGVRLPSEQTLALKYRGDARNWLKRRFITDVLNSRAVDFASPVCRLVGVLWPSVLRFIREANFPERRLIGALQRFESWLVIETVAPRLVDRVPILPVHDSIWCRESDVPTVRGEFESVFEELGLNFKLRED
jgi:hypothetical protein